MTPREAFRLQSKACEKLGSPFMGRLLGLMAARLSSDTAVGRCILDWEGDPGPGADSVPLRLAGALHALKLDGLALEAVYPPNHVSDEALWQAVMAALETCETRILDWLTRPPQTNEVRRSAVILAALAEVGARYPDQTVELLELGCSGGLNLQADHYRAEFPGLTLGTKNTSVVLKPEWTGPMPPSVLPSVVARRGVDLSPLGLKDRLRFLAYLWPDQPDRLHLTEAALSIAAKSPPPLDAGDAAAWLETTLATPSAADLRVVFHTVAWQYFPYATKARALEALGNTTLVQIAMESDHKPPGAAVTLTHWPEGRTEPLGRADFHGRWIAWD